MHTFKVSKTKVTIKTKGDNRMRKVKIEDAIGLSIGHDMTRVIPGTFKGVAFKKGHIITEEDVIELKKIGKENVYLDTIPEGYMHEDDCAVRIASAIAEQDNFTFSEVSEGKINIISKVNGILKVNKEMLYNLNSIEHIAICTKFEDTPVKRGDVVASERIIPLYTKKENIEAVEETCKQGGKLINVVKYVPQEIQLIITGNEVFNGLIKDRFYEALKPKVESYGCKISSVVKAPDDKEYIKEKIKEAVESGADIVICTGGMSVDEDDITPIAIKEEADNIVVHGLPVQPGNMFLLSYKKNTPIIGVPGAVMYYKATIFDLVFPKLACKQKISKDYFINLGLGGLCDFCKVCHYPNCSFLKGR